MTQHEAEVAALGVTLDAKTTAETTATNLVTSTLLANDIQKEKQAGCSATPCKDAAASVFAGTTKDLETATTNETNAVGLITNYDWGTAKSEAVTAK